MSRSSTGINFEINLSQKSCESSIAYIFFKDPRLPGAKKEIIRKEIKSCNEFGTLGHCSMQRN